MKKIFLLYLLLAVMKLSFANDAYVMLCPGGTPEILQEENKSVRMVSEIIEIKMLKEYYITTAVFNFENLGDSLSVMMGFPENGIFYDLSDTNILNNGCFIFFKSDVDGESVPVERILVATNRDGTKVKLPFWVKKVKFEKGQSRKITVNYGVHYSKDGSISYNSRELQVEYNFTGGNWYGKVENSKLTVIPVEGFCPENIDTTEIKLINGNYVFEKSNWEAEYPFELNGKVESNILTVYSTIYQVPRKDSIMLEISSQKLEDSSNIVLYSWSFRNLITGEEIFTSPLCISMEYGTGVCSQYLNYKFSIHSNLPNFFYYFDLKKSKYPSYIFYNVIDNDIKITGVNANAILCKKNISEGKYSVYFIIYFYNRRKAATDEKFYYGEYCDTMYVNTEDIELLENRSALNKDDSYEIDEFYVSDNDDKRLIAVQKENLVFLAEELNKEKNKLIDNNNYSLLEACILQLIFMGKEKEAWEFFDIKLSKTSLDKTQLKNDILQYKEKIRNFEF